MADRCTAVTMVGDDRWGAMADVCDLHAGHPGPHVSEQSACNPKAWRSWWGTYDPDLLPRPEGARASEHFDESG